MAWSLIWPLLGVLLIALAQVDIVATVLHPQVESPFSNRFHRITWWALLSLARRWRRRARGHAMLSWALPLMVAGLIGLWLLLLLWGFALIYYPWISVPGHFTRPGISSPAFVDALYFSGSALTTAGFGDIQPVSWPFRALAIAEAGSGIVVVSLSVAYLLAVYPSLAHKRAVAVALDAEVAGRGSALPMVRRYLADGDDHRQELTSRLHELSRDLLALTESHVTHPVLYYARSPDVRHSFLRILVTAQSLVELLRYGLSPERHRDIVRDPQILLLEQTLHYSLRQLSSSLHIPDIDHSHDADQRRRLAQDFQAVCEGLEGLGLVSSSSAALYPVAALTEAGPDDGNAPAVVQSAVTALPNPRRGRTFAATGARSGDALDPALDLSASSAEESFIAFRLETDPHILAYATASGYALEDATRDYGIIWDVRDR